MKLIAFDGFLFEEHGYWAGLPVQHIGHFQMMPQTMQRRAQAGLYTGATVAPRTISVEFGYDGGALTYEQAFQKLIGILDPTNEEPRTLTAELNDGTQVECQATVLPPGPMATTTGANGDEINVQPVTFFTVDPHWRKPTPNVMSVTCSGNTAVALLNQGSARAYPEFSIGWTAQRTSSTSSVGWKYRRQVTITNNGDEDWHDEPMCVDLGDTSAWVSASKALSSGNDVRVRYQGRELNRTLVNFNTGKTFCWFLVSIPAGARATYDIVYGNPNAGAPRTLSDRSGSLQTYVAPDLEGTSGTMTGSTVSTITLSGAGWETNRWRNGWVYIVNTGRASRIASNTGDTLTLNRSLASSPSGQFCVFMSGIFIDGGRVSSTTSTSITDSGLSTGWGTNQLEGATVTFLTGSANPSTMTVKSNTSDTITFTSSFSTQPSAGDSYRIERQGVYSYVVDEALTETRHRGLYRINNYYSGYERMWPGELTPGGWGPDTYLDNNDDYRQLDPQNRGAGGGHSQNWWPLLRATRRVRQPARLLQEGVGDGMSIYTPFRLQGVYFDYEARNQNGIGMQVFAYKEPAGDTWQVAHSDSTTRASLTAVSAQYLDLDALNNPTRFGMFVAPADGVEIPSGTATSDQVEIRNGDVLILYLATDTFGGLTNGRYAVGSEESIYDLNVILRLGGGEESTKKPPYHRIVVGGSGHRLQLASGEVLRIRTDPTTSQPLAAVYDNSGTLQYRAPWAVRVYRHEADIDGNDTALISRDFMPVKPYNNLLPNGSFADGLTGWTIGATTGSGTATWDHDTVTSWDSDGAARVDLDADTRTSITSPAFATVPGQRYGVWFTYRTSEDDVDNLENTSITAIVYGANTGSSFALLFTPLGILTPDEWLFAGDAFTASDTEYYIEFELANTLLISAQMWIDAVAVGTPLLYITETSMGTLAIDISLREGFNG